MEVIPPEGCFQMPEPPHGGCTSTPQLPGMPLREVRETLQRPRQQDWEAGQRAGTRRPTTGTATPAGKEQARRDPGGTRESTPSVPRRRCPGVTGRRRIPRSATDGV